MNAIILAAGKSNRFAPFSYERPKGLFRVRGEVLIERQIDQLHAAGITEIQVVIGYMKEKFFYLEQKYGVHLVVNNEFGKKGNLYSLYMARQYLKNTFICCADQYFPHNPFLYDNKENYSYRMCAYMRNKFREFAVECSDADVITTMHVGGRDSLAMVGCAYLNEKFSSRFCEYMEAEINDFGIASMFWEEFYAKHMNELTMYTRMIEKEQVLEFDSIEDLRTFDSEFLTNIDSEIIENICNTLHCNPNDIVDISVINAGLTNVSFAFMCQGIKYVYRHPGGTAGNLINRQAELFAQMSAKEIEIDQSFIKMDLSGWKISYFVENAKNCDFEQYPEQLEIGMEYLHRLHALQSDGTVKIFDDVEEGKKLMQIASATKGNLFREFETVIKKVEKLYAFIKMDAARLGYSLVPCHNDTYEPNYLYNDKGEIFLIDWEYAGMNYAANDICCITCRYDWTEEQIEKYFSAFVGRELTEEEHRFYWAFHPICSFYWFCWGLYKGSVGDDDGFFFLPAYRNLCKYIDRAINSYEAEYEER